MTDDVSKANDGATPATATGPQDKPEPAATPHERPKYVTLWNNFITMSGLFLVIVAPILLLTFGLFTVITPTPNPYVDILGYLVIPSILVLGLILTPLGIFLRSWRLHRRDPEQRLAFRFPHFDLKDPLQRRAAKIILTLTFLMLPVLGVSGYHGYHYTDSVQFCAKSCHTVMEPQATTYEHSAHARVSCAECHIGSGASWFVKAKLSGTRQVFATLRDTFPRPIPPAIHNLRPARETCERCHWPQKFYGAQLARIVNYAADENNTCQEVDMLLKIGGGDLSSGRLEGIHKHMALEKIEYIATDDRLQEIPWVKWTDEGGNELIYRSDGRPSSDPIPEGQLRQLDCMDCHNRPAHEFRSPERAVDIYLEVGRIDTTLPFIKREAVAALVQPYPDIETAEAQIGKHLADYYRSSYADVWEKRKASVNQAIDEVREIYSNNFFPDMNVDWRTYPDNIGHKNSAGCFRCHAGRHVNQHGDLISHECSICHTFLNPLNDNGRANVVQEGEFIHPAELEGLHADLMCHQCHTGGVAPATTCEACHGATSGLRAATLSQLSIFDINKSPMFESVECKDCHDLSEPASLDVVDVLCMECHEDEEEKYEGMLSGWSREVSKKRRRAEAEIKKLADWIDAHLQEGFDNHAAIEWAFQGRAIMELLDQAGPLHNYDAATSIYDNLTSEAQQQLTQLKAMPAPGT